ncbi:MAG: hypothetical protein DRG71_03840 [Deltaproteobacteria bacterium]|nr:MAG: hypothetical protein DRG71_03840 [Deltaproteobacteria bacterium]
MKHKDYFAYPQLLLLLLAMVLSACGAHEYRLRRAKLLYHQGQLLQTQGKIEEATKKFEASLALSRREGFRPGIAHNLNELAIIKVSKGEYVKARQLLEEALGIYKSLRMSAEVSKVMNNLAITYLEQGDPKGALTAYNELLQWDKATGNILGQLIVLYNMGEIYEEYLNQPCQAKPHFEAAFHLALSLGRRKLAKKIRHKISSLNCQ